MMTSTRLMGYQNQDTDLLNKYVERHRKYLESNSARKEKISKIFQSMTIPNSKTCDNFAQ